MTTNEKTNTDRMATRVERGERKMATNGKESKMKITASNLIRWAGLSAMVAGIIFVVIQPIHPLDVLSSVTTAQWAIIHSLKTAMCLFGLLGLRGSTPGKWKRPGGLVWPAISCLASSVRSRCAFAFTEAFILPLLATEAPKFVESFLGIFNGHPGEMNLGALPTLYALAGFGYVLGGLLFGIATFRAGILPRWAAGLLAVGAVLPPLVLRCSRTRSIGYLRCRWG